jgi:hypothetical protein
MQMTPPGELKPLQVRLPGPVLEEFKQYAQEQGQSMASLVLGWIQGALAGDAPPSASASGVIEPRGGAGFSADVLAELKVQTALLQRLVEQEAAATPGGGTERAPVVVTEREVVRPKAEPFGLVDYTERAQPDCEQSQAAVVQTTASEPPVPLPPATGLSLVERMRSAAPFTPEQAAALAPCEARQLFNNEEYENLSEEVEIELASGVVVKGQAAGQFDGWVQVTPCRGNEGWPVEVKDALHIAAPITACVWPSRLNMSRGNNSEEDSND